MTCTTTATAAPDWAANGATRAVGDPMLDVDAVNGPGPETVTVVDPPDGVYLAGAYVAAGGTLLNPTAVTVTVSIDGDALRTSDTRLLFEGELWAPFAITVTPEAFTVSRYNGCSQGFACLVPVASGPELFQCSP